MRTLLLLVASLCACSPKSSDDDDGDSTDDLVTTQGAFEITSVPAELGMFGDYFSQYTAVFGVHIFATAAVPEAKLLHAAGVMAQYLDNDEDGTANDTEVIRSMTQEHGGSGLVMFGTEMEIESSGIFDAPLPDMHLQDLYAEETMPEGSEAGGRFDATLEEVLHLIQHAGISDIHDAFSLDSGSPLANAMDTARGGHFTSVPSEYPDAAWYHYDDQTCDYECMMVEYFYWGLTTLLGAQDYPGRCDEIDHEWEPCTPEAFTETDVDLHALLTDPQYNLPTVLPDGRYRSD